MVETRSFKNFICFLLCMIGQSIGHSSASATDFPVPRQDKKTYYEAKSYLATCVSWKSQSGCRSDQDLFVRQYINAMASDLKAQKDVVFHLINGAHDPDNGAGGSVRPNQVQACAWSKLIASSGSPYLTSEDLSSVVLVCDGLRPIDEAAANLRAQKIASEIRSSNVQRVAVPQLDYDPRDGKDETAADQ